MLRLDGLEDGAGGVVHVEVAAGAHAVIAVGDPDALARCVAGVGPGHGGVRLGESVLTGASAARRWQAGLAVVLSALPEDAGPSILDVILLGDGSRGRWETLAAALGTRRAHGRSADAEAAARALAGRIGLAPWLDTPVTAAPPHARASADLARALSGTPKALVWRRPEWLRPVEIRSLAAFVQDEARRLGLAVLEVREATPLARR
jgi:ABC-type branched-subunit amino acid transport system ATPase component